MVLATGGGAALAMWAWASARRAEGVEDQVEHLVLAIVGGGVVVVAAIVWIAVGTRVLAHRRLMTLDRLANQLWHAEPEASIAVDADGPSNTLVARPGSARYHRADCLLVRDKPVDHGSVEVDRRPCEMCTP